MRRARSEPCVRSGALRRTVNSPGHPATARLATPEGPRRRPVPGPRAPHPRSPLFEAAPRGTSLRCPMTTCCDLANLRSHPTSAFTSRNGLISRLCCGVWGRSDQGRRWKFGGKARLAPLSAVRRPVPRRETPSLLMQCRKQHRRHGSALRVIAPQGCQPRPSSPRGMFFINLSSLSGTSYLFLPLKLLHKSGL